MDAKLVPVLKKNTALFYRGPTSRKPYKVRFVRIVTPLTANEVRQLDDQAFPEAAADEIVDYNVEIEFSSLKCEVVRSSFVFNSWEIAEHVAPLREKVVRGEREITVMSDKRVLLESGKEVSGLGIRIGHLDAGVTADEADTLWRKLAVALGYQIDFLKRE